ncbi:putative transcriptional regulatory protein [Lachnellula hyalina]|uniref:Putative transcriptional regulatory protein n=1 Tax=Lachnellula hyalina TaxID=1316788 RepID=A0A8H8R9G3_9HELO|nr:putative transcriptional regulatory protein [Lachnellula hyalina]TVY30806.1 putative transcriptional regulatory protein [Lachnellula hyalina]
MMTVILGEDREGQKQTKASRTKRSVACNYCRLKKDRGEKCVYLALKRRGRKESHGSGEFVLNRIARMEAMLQEANVVPPLLQNFGETDQHVAPVEGLEMMANSSQDLHKHHMPLSPPHTEQSRQSLQWSRTDHTNLAKLSQRRGSNISERGDAYSNYSNSSQSAALANINEQTYQDQIENSLSDGARTINANSSIGTSNSVIDPALNTAVDRGINSIASPENSDWEYHGPGSFLSICSKPGIEWVGEKTGSSDFIAISRTFSRDVTRQLKLDCKISLDRTPEPDRATAWRYTKAYFEKTLESAFDIVVRSSFEARLNAHFANDNASGQDEDAAWYSLRNTVYAFGCRAELGRTSYSSTFAEAQIAGWKYFQNAMSRHMELIYCRTGLMAVQALVTMALYVEGAGCPALEYMLCSVAWRLAQSKGLHRQAGTAWGMGAQEIQHRNWIFWILYSYEKHIAHRSGRSSAIDDDDISCHIPTTVPTGSSNNVEFCTYVIKHAQLSSQIGKRFSTVQAYRQSPESIAKTACELDQKLREWRDLLPPSMRPGTAINSSEIPPNLDTVHVIYLHYAFFGSLIAIHSTVTYPWSDMFGRDENLTFRNQVDISTQIVADASRNIILAAKYINDINASTPLWLVFYYPVLGLINLFVHVVKHPTAPSAPSDITLMEVVAGHFARLEFASSGELTFSFARELSRLARLAVKKAQQKLDSESSKDVDIVNTESNYRFFDQPQNLMKSPENGMSGRDLLSHSSNNQNAGSFAYLDNMTWGEFDVENWSALLPSFSPDEMMDLNGMPGNCDMSFLPT